MVVVPRPFMLVAQDLVGVLDLLKPVRRLFRPMSILVWVDSRQPTTDNRQPAKQSRGRREKGIGRSDRDGSEVLTTVGAQGRGLRDWRRAVSVELASPVQEGSWQRGMPPKQSFSDCDAWVLAVAAVQSSGKQTPGFSTRRPRGAIVSFSLTWMPYQRLFAVSFLDGVLFSI